MPNVFPQVIVFAKMRTVGLDICAFMLGDNVTVPLPYGAHRGHISFEQVVVREYQNMVNQVDHKRWAQRKLPRYTKTCGGPKASAQVFPPVQQVLETKRAMSDPGRISPRGQGHIHHSQQQRGNFMQTFPSVLRTKTVYGTVGASNSIPKIMQWSNAHFGSMVHMPHSRTRSRINDILSSHGSPKRGLEEVHAQMFPGQIGQIQRTKLWEDQTDSGSKQFPKLTVQQIVLDLSKEARYPQMPKSNVIRKKQLPENGENEKAEVTLPRIKSSENETDETAPNVERTSDFIKFTFPKPLLHNPGPSQRMIKGRKKRRGFRRFGLLKKAKPVVAKQAENEDTNSNEKGEPGEGEEKEGTGSQARIEMPTTKQEEEEEGDFGVCSKTDMGNADKQTISATVTVAKGE